MLFYSIILRVNLIHFGFSLILYIQKLFTTCLARKTIELGPEINKKVALVILVAMPRPQKQISFWGSDSAKESSGFNVKAI